MKPSRNLSFAEEASVASALCRLVVKSTPTIAARASVEHEGREGAGIFLAGIAQDDTKAIFEAHRLEYIANIRQPFDDLVAEVQDLYGSGRVMRPNRDLRFRIDKSPDKTSAAMSAGSLGGVYLRVCATGLEVGGSLRRAVL